MLAEPPGGPYLQDLAFFLTFRCQIACAHCFAHAGPHRAEVMEAPEVLDWIEQAARYDRLRIKAIDFTGGEPFLELGLLRRAAAHADSLGLIVTCVTNAGWAVTPAEARRVLRGLPGLSALEVSADRHHQERVPLACVENAIEAARELGIVASASVCTESEQDPLHLRLLGRLRARLSPDQIRVTVTRPAGRALVRLEQKGEDAADASVPRKRCGVDGPYVLPDGRVIACIGVLDLVGDSPLVLGNLRAQPLEEVLTGADRSYGLHFLRLYGPAALRDALVESGFDCELDRMRRSSDPCALCLHLMTRARIRDGLGVLAGDPERLNLLASARLFHLGEDAMVRWLGLAEDDAESSDAPRA